MGHGLPALPPVLAAAGAAAGKGLKVQLCSVGAEGLKQAQLIAGDVGSAAGSMVRGDVRQASLRGWAAFQRLTGSGIMLALSRLLVCSYFAAAAYDQYAAWAFMQQPEVKLRAERWPQHYPIVPFPWLGLLLLAPCAALAAVGVWPPATAGVLAVWEAWHAGSLVWASALALVQYDHKPNELVVKRVAMLGSVCMLLAHGGRRSRVLTSYAGLLLGGGDDCGKGPRVSARKSLVLLLCRCAMAFLFVFVGVTQAHRIMERDFVIFSGNRIPHSRLWERDGHDNNWLLLEFALALPFAAGFRTAATARLLALTLALEAATCWPFWQAWPSFAYASHVRLHFVVNLGVAGGLLLLASFGAGRFTVDALMKKRQ